MSQALRSITALLATSITVLVPLTARALQPESGMWTVNGEVNGKPGRGLQIDAQGGRNLIVTYFGYREDGSSMFLQASGPRQDDGTFTADLVEFQGGKALGAPARDGQVRKVVGNISIAFDSATTASVTLPGEAPARMTRFQYEDHTARFNREGRYAISYALATFGNLMPATVTFKLENGNFSMSRNNGDLETCEYSGRYQPAGQGIKVEGTFACKQANSSSSGTFWTEEMEVDEQLSYRAVIWKQIQGSSINPSAEYHYGLCQAAAMFLTPNRCTKP
ncbi:hypothetical protein ACDW_15210 [Acidovorax sp. DW039]|uniref:hypothetical protein n=1 Tax=Acidovorax sp. DW039 TaxID=3095606 RepID=UPI0030901692|nr:hypothetical protein ACDW_15210 [Acidovorax sp. DW039]